MQYTQIAPSRPDVDDVADLAELQRLVLDGVLTLPNSVVVPPEDLPGFVDGIAANAIHEKVLLRY